jgi:hypothetical protein
MARTACAPQGATLRLKLDITQLHAGDPCDALDINKTKYTITLGTVSGSATAADITNKPLTGTLTVNPSNANQLYVDIAFAEIATTTGNLTFNAELQAFDGCVSESYNCTIIDRWVTPKTSVCSVSPDPVSEGNIVTFTLTESNVNSGDTVNYTITGITSADINGASLTGTATYGAEQCTNTLSVAVPFTISTDLVHPETETMTLTWASGEVCSTVITSVAPPVAYNFSCASGVTEGSPITWNWSATNVTVPNGTVLNYVITGSAVTDGTITATSGSFTVNSNAGTFQTPTIQNVIDDGTRQAIATITTGSPYNQVATCNVNDDDPSCLTKLVQAPIAWTPCYNGTDGQLESLTVSEYGTFHTGSTQVPTAITVAKSSASVVTVTSSVGIDVTAGQIGTKVQLIPGSSSSNSFNTVPANGPVTGSSVVEAFMQTHY